MRLPFPISFPSPERIGSNEKGGSKSALLSVFGESVFTISSSLTMRLYFRSLDRIDAWIAAPPDPKPSRPEAIRRLVEKGLASL